MRICTIFGWLIHVFITRPALRRGHFTWALWLLITYYAVHHDPTSTFAWRTNVWSDCYDELAYLSNVIYTRCYLYLFICQFYFFLKSMTFDFVVANDWMECGVIWRDGAVNVYRWTLRATDPTFQWLPPELCLRTETYSSDPHLRSSVREILDDPGKSLCNFSLTFYLMTTQREAYTDPATGSSDAFVKACYFPTALRGNFEPQILYCILFFSSTACLRFADICWGNQEIMTWYGKGSPDDFYDCEGKTEVYRVMYQ